MAIRTPDVITVAVTRADGGLSVTRIIVAEYRPLTEEEKRRIEEHGDPVPERVESWRVEPTDEYVESILAKYNWQGPLKPVSWRRVPNDFVDEATDRTFRNAWKDAPGRGKPDVDMPKAREIHREKLRGMRAPLLEELDTEYLRADEAGDAALKAQVAKRKRKLREVTDDPAIDAAATPEELKAVIPEALRG